MMMISSFRQLKSYKVHPFFGKSKAVLSQGVHIYIEIEKKDTQDYIKIILMKTPHTAQAYFDGGYIVFIFKLTCIVLLLLMSRYSSYRFRMNRPLFLRILKSVEEHDEYFQQSINAAHQLGLSCLQKVTAAFRMLTYGVPADATDEYVRIGESTSIQSLKKIVKAVIEIFGDEYLREPNENDIAKLFAIGKERGFPGMLGSLDCMHWEWKNCPSAYQGMYSGYKHKPTIILEAVASKDLYIWHAFFGLPGSLNDINVLHRSPLFSKLSNGEAPKVNYNINGHDYTMGYYLADGIYPSWATLVKTIPEPRGSKRTYFAKAQEAVRKDVERAFGVLQSERELGLHLVPN
jgi:hypothetical protein